MGHLRLDLETGSPTSSPVHQPLAASSSVYHLSGSLGTEVVANVLSLARGSGRDSQQEVSLPMTLTSQSSLAKQ